tara:strand:- start:51188 stop:53653 length:2466 start_codon:yes stop_codon:yes gene_type:complete
MKKNNVLSLLFLFFVAFGFAQTDAERAKITSNYDLDALRQLEDQLAAQFAAEKEEALVLASINGWEEFIEIENGGQAELVGVFPSGEPIYYATENPQGAITTRTDKVHTGGGAGLDLNGEDMVGGVWDGGRVRETHELIGGRATQVDGATDISSHSTHVAGTMIGTGDVFSGNAKGMAPMATLLAHSFSNDEAEMTAAAATGLLVSNHSYGIPADGVPLWYLGYYDSNARDMDEIVYNAPHYLPVCSAGNDRQSGANTGDGGYDYLTDKSVAKNTLICAAVNEVLNYTGPSSVVMSSFSSWGPTDDGRVKPDISAKGVNMLSSTGGNNSSYANFSGTSMATPNTSGSLILLQQHYNDLNGVFMLSSMLRGLALHTVDEAGNNPGPDYRFGWGLLNTERAAQVITDRGNQSEMRDIVLAQGETYTLEVKSDDINDLITSITWTDPAGTVPPAGVEDAFIPALVNDLDLRVTEVGGGTTFMPWKLDPSDFNAAATTGDNIVDNIEKIEVGGATGNYLIEVTHKGTLTNAVQSFSLIVTGIVNDFTITTNENNQEICNDETTASYAMDVEFIDTFSETVTFTVSGVPTGAVGTVTPTTLDDDGQITLNLTGLDNAAPGEYFMTVTGTSATATNAITLGLEIISIDLDPVTLVSPVDEATDINIDRGFDWEALLEPSIEYVFELATDEAFGTIVETATTENTSTVVNGLDFATEYFWRVRGTNVCGEGENSDVFSFTTRDEVLGINENTLDGLVVYPNPTSNVLNVTAATQMVSLDVVNILGQTLLSQEVGASQTQVDLSALAAGNYFIRVQAENATAVIQIVKK